MTCCNCNLACKKFGKFGPKRIQRYRCKACKRTFSDEQNKPLGNMQIPMDKAEMILQLLIEGNSIRSIQRITGVHQVTILSRIAPPIPLFTSRRAARSSSTTARWYVSLPPAFSQFSRLSRSTISRSHRNRRPPSRRPVRRPPPARRRVAY